MKRTCLWGLSLLVASSAAFAQKTMKAPSGGKAISDHLIGIFFEDINSSADGGLNAEMVQNGSFEYNLTEHDGWSANTAWKVLKEGHSTGHLQVLQKDPIHPNNPNYMQIYVERVKKFDDFNGWIGIGLQNEGFEDFSVKAGAKYDFSVFLRSAENTPKEVRVALVNPEKGMQVLSETTLTTQGTDWKSLSAVLTSQEDCQHAKLRLICLTEGTIDVDEVSFIPQDTYKGHGIRRDLAEALEALHPHFMRFPGGCVVHGGGLGMWDTYRWKNTIGPRWQRKPLKNTWGYHQSMAVGYYEYFQLCEDMGMEPLPILPCGVSCQGAGGGWCMPGQQMAVPMDDMQEWVDEALDLIEWANGDVTTTWGKKRAEAGHPEPFNLKYLGLGNEEYISPEFCERFRYIYERVTKAYPDILIVGTAGPGSHPGSDDFTNGWKLADELGVPLLDEHYYEAPEYFLTSRQYDSYPRDRKTKVYLGEYASRDCKLINALSEALYLLHVERNADVVDMTSYAPLFGRVGACAWNPDLIYYDNDHVYLTPDYYVQQMFGLSAGQYYYGNCVKMSRPEDNLLGQSVILNTQTRTLYVKLCNAGDKPATASLNLSRFPGLQGTASRMLLTGQPDDVNNDRQHPVSPTTEEVTIQKKMQVEMAPYSFVMYTLPLK